MVVVVRSARPRHFGRRVGHVLLDKFLDFGEVHIPKGGRSEEKPCGRATESTYPMTENARHGMNKGLWSNS